MISEMKPIYLNDLAASIDIEALYAEVLALDWETKKTARREYFMSETPREYSYGNKHTGSQVYHSRDFSPLVDNARKVIGGGYNVCFLNRYEDEKQHLGWHSDDFPGMDETAGIAVLSLGAERYIHWKPIEMKGVLPSENMVLLEHGSLWTMPPGFQDGHVHKIPKHSRPCGVRISLTFRKFN